MTAEGSRSVRVEIGGHVVQVDGPDSLKTLERTALRVLKQTRNLARHIPIGFGTVQPQIERLPEEL